LPAAETAARKATTLRPAIGQRLRAALEAKALSQREAARRARVSNVHWCQVEHGLCVPALATLARMGAACGVGLAWLVADGLK